MCYLFLIIGNDCQMKEIQMVKKIKQALFTLLSLVVFVNVTSLGIVLASDSRTQPHPDVEGSKHYSRVQLQDEQATSESDNLALQTSSQSTLEVFSINETVLAIFSHIESPRDFTNAAGTCRLWRSVAADDILHLSKDPSKLHKQLVDLPIIELSKLCLRGSVAEEPDGPSTLFRHYLRYFQWEHTEGIIKLNGGTLSFYDADWEQHLTQDSSLLSRFTPYLRALSIAAFFHHSQAKKHLQQLQAVTSVLSPSQSQPTTALKELQKTIKKVHFPLIPVSNYKQYKDMLLAEMYQSSRKNENYTRAMSILGFLFPQVHAVRLGGDTTNQYLLPQSITEALEQMSLQDSEHRDLDDLQSTFLMAKNRKAFDPIFLYEARECLGMLREVRQNEFEKVLNRLSVLKAINDRRLQNLSDIIHMYLKIAYKSTDPNKKTKYYKIAAEYTDQKIKLLSDKVAEANFDRAINIHRFIAQHSTDANVKATHFKMAASYLDQHILLLGNGVTVTNIDEAIGIHQEVVYCSTDDNVKAEHLKMIAEYNAQLNKQTAN